MLNISLEDFLDSFYDQATYVKVYKKNPAYDYDVNGQIIYFNRLYTRGLIERVEHNFKKFTSLFNPYELSMLKKTYNVENITDKEVDAFRKLVIKKKFTDLDLFNSHGHNFIENDHEVMNGEKMKFPHKLEDSLFPDGTPRKISTTKVPFKLDGKIIGVIGFSKDRSGSYNLFKNLESAFSGAILVVDALGRIVYRSPHTPSFFGYSSDRFNQIVHVKEIFARKDDRKKIIRTLYSEKSGEKTFDDVSLKRLNGEIFKAKVAAGIRTHERSTQLFHATIIDIQGELRKSLELDNIKALVRQATTNIQKEVSKAVNDVLQEKIFENSISKIVVLNSLDDKFKELFNLYVHTNLSTKNIAPLTINWRVEQTVKNRLVELAKILGIENDRNEFRKYAQSAGIYSLSLGPSSLRLD